MAEIPLLYARAKERSEPGDVSAGALETGDWLGAGIVLKIVVGAELLAACNFAVEANRELIVVCVGGGHSRERPRSQRCDVVVVKREGRGIEALRGNMVIGKNGRVLSAHHNRSPRRCGATWTGVQQISERLIRDTTLKGLSNSGFREIAARFGRRGQQNCPRRNALN